MDDSVSSGLQKKLLEMDSIRETSPQGKTFQTAWILRDFFHLQSDFCSGNDDAYTISPLQIDLPALNYSAQWILGCNPNVYDRGGDVKVSVKIPVSTVKLDATVTIGQLDRKGAEQVMRKEKILQTLIGQYRLVEGYISHNALKTRAEDLLPNGHLNIFIRVRLHQAPATLVLRRHIRGHRTEMESNEDLCAAMQTAGFEDGCTDSVVLAFADGEERCHTFPLVARSPVFKAMLAADMREKKTGRIELPNIGLQTGRDLMYYLYNGQVRHGSDATSLLPVADMYDIPGLKAWCEHELPAAVSASNCLELLDLAALYRLSSLKDAVMKYISDNAGRLHTNKS